MVNKTADCFNKHCFYFGSEKTENNATLEKVLRLVGATFDSKVASLRRMRKKNLIILKSLQKKSLSFFVLFVCRCWHLSCQISIVKCLENCNMLTVRTYESAVIEIFLNIITILHFYWAIINWNFIWHILISIMAFIAMYAIKVFVRIRIINWIYCH